MVRSYCDKPTDPAQNVSKAATSERCTKLSLNMLSLLFFNRLQFKHEAKGSFDEGVCFLDETTYCRPNCSLPVIPPQIKQSEMSSRCLVVNAIRIAAFLGLYASLGQWVALHAQEPASRFEPVPAGAFVFGFQLGPCARHLTPRDNNRIWAKKRKWHDRRERREDVDVFYIHPTMYMEGAPWNVGPTKTLT